MQQSRKQLRQVSDVRVVGFKDAVLDLGTHRVCGTPVPYSRQHIYNVLKGKLKSQRLLELIAVRRPDLFELHYVSDEVKAFYGQWLATHSESRKVASRPSVVQIGINLGDFMAIKRLQKIKGGSVADVVHSLVTLGLKV